MENGISAKLQQIERTLLAALERHGSDGRAITIESLAATAGVAGSTNELALALKHLVERGLVRRAGEDPIPGSAIAFRLVRPVSRDEIAKAEDQSGLPSTPAEQMSPRPLVPARRAGVPAE